MKTILFALVGLSQSIKITQPIPEQQTWYFGQTVDDKRFFNSEDQDDFVLLDKMDPGDNTPQVDMKEC